MRRMTLQPARSGNGRTRDQLFQLPRRVTVELDAARLNGHNGHTAERVGTARAVLVLDCDDVELLVLVSEGLAPAVIGRRMHLNERTIRRRLTRLCDRLGVSTPVQAVVWAVRHGVI
jgi:DNA-binding NarL/FixJ family response regulator